MTVSDDIMRSLDNNTTISPVRNSTLTGFSMNPKDNIDPGISNSSTSTTTRRSIVTMKTTVKAQTKNSSRATTPVKPMKQAETKETPFESKTTLTTKYIEPQDRSDLHVEQNPEKKKHGGGIEREMIIAIGATLVVLSVALTITIIVIRRRKSYKRGASGSALSEDSDVRFLTSDEILDFNLARPTDNDEM
ncbi:mam domain-containing glycosylphosphatidylinositol anchor protein 1 [Lasius niger]|uniref:Mam domain-containing glycosylphosphatidylinositol anchor protein 1 n=1 Tax=Lasius niger TaxID=67767 RepID=A0A0J7P0R0_LASNI|nr:mam domain-containing glycosylphosphatidylinositol anchor protein 1 [Lasius niger]